MLIIVADFKLQLCRLGTHCFSEASLQCTPCRMYECIIVHEVASRFQGKWSTICLQHYRFSPGGLCHLGWHHRSFGWKPRNSSPEGIAKPPYSTLWVKVWWKASYPTQYIVGSYRKLRKIQWPDCWWTGRVSFVHTYFCLIRTTFH